MKLGDGEKRIGLRDWKHMDLEDRRDEWSR